MSENSDEELDRSYPVEDWQIQALREKGHVTLRGVLSPELLAAFGSEISRVVEEYNRDALPMEMRSSYGKSFIQMTNLWQRSEVVKRFSLNRRCAEIADRLMGCSGVRMWHDQALFKEPGGGITSWHCDQFFWPMSSERSVTAWIPLQATPLEMGPVYFADRSHTDDYGRNMGISDEGEERIGAAISDAELDCEPKPFDLGDVSFHSGWTMHRAEENRTGEMRGVMTIIYMDAEMRLVPPANPFQEHDRKTWCPGIEVGELMASSLNPVLFGD